MTNMKSTKRALLTSVMAMLLCFTMLLGTTFAWFTDSVTSGNNIIKSGNLDIELEYAVFNDDGTFKKWQDVKGASDILTNTLWEPGVTEVAYLRIANAGTLAFKYQLGINIVSEIDGTNVYGQSFKLSDYIQFGVVEGVDGSSNAYSKDDAGRTAAIAAVTDAKKISAGYNPAEASMESGDEFYLALVVYMPETVGNEANYKTSEDSSNPNKYRPQIDLGINVFATQMTAEEDSFNDQYDVNAPFSMWDGVVPTEMPASLVVDGATQTIHVKDAAAFAYLSTLSAKWAELYTDGNGRDYLNYANGAGGDYYYSSKWTVSLEADIDLGNYSIAPVDIKLGESTGASAFNGNGHTIRNINATTGLFADFTSATFSNFTLENVTATRGALAGGTKGAVRNVTVKNATISGTDYVGGLVGSAYSSVTGCKVIDSSVVATGKEAGGMIGYIETSSAATVANNIVNNVNVYAGNRAAGLVAQVNVNVKVYNNTVDTVTVGAADTTTYQPGAVVSNALDAANVYDNTVINASVATKAALVTDAAGLKEAAKNNDVVYAEGVVVDGSSQLNTGATIIGATFKNENGIAVTQTISGTFKDCVFEGSEALRWCYSKAGETVVFENCVIKTDFRGVHFDGMEGNVVFRNCEINGFNAIGGEGTVTFENCTFGNDRSSYNGLNMYSNINLIDCTFNYVSGKTNFIDMEGTGKTLTIKNCVATLDGADANILTFVGGSKLSQNTVVVDGVTQ